jgi:Ser/Thr protein kinase RdoA (MazF antagonist)
MIEKLIFDQYGLEVQSLSVIPSGVGGITYYVKTAVEKYILKSCKDDGYIRNEPEVAAFLKQNDIPVAEYIKTKRNEYFWEYKEKLYLLKRYIDGAPLDYNSAPDWFMVESVRILGRIHSILARFRPLPIGMGQGFIDFMASGHAKISYTNTLKKALERGDNEIANDIEYRLTRVDELNRIHFDSFMFSTRNTHGDYKVGNIICKDNHIAAIIDFSGVCIHPAVWEIIRSFTYADPSCKNGNIDIERFLKYVKEYLVYSTLNEYDLKMMPFFFYCQLLACDYYMQYYEATEQNRDDFLHQAKFATKLIKWFDKNIDELSDALLSLV